MRVAHLSDLHLLDLVGAVPGRLFNKRATGYINLRLKRAHSHKPEPVRAAARALGGLGIDHLVVTGDVSNLALEREFDRVLELLELTGLPPEQITLVPGNHDVYTAGSARSRRFETWFSRFLVSDLPEATGAPFPSVKLRGPLAIIGLSSAVPRPPLVASGRLGGPQRAALRELLDHPEVASRRVLIAQHHPTDKFPSALKTRIEGLDDADAELELLRGLRDPILLHGHWHRRRFVEVGALSIVGAPSASLLHEDPRKLAGFNVLSFGSDGQLEARETYRYRADGGFDAGPLEGV